MIHDFIKWIEATQVSKDIQEISWIIPLVQTIHILAISVVFSSMAMLDLRLIGVIGQHQSIRTLSDRFMPWLWGALGILLVTGSILVTGEPDRSLANWTFQIKMVLLLLAVLVTLAFQTLLKRGKPDADLSSAQQILAKATGAVSLVLWVSIITAGRWIAYTR